MQSPRILRHRLLGLTLFELIITLSIVAILGGIAIPAMNDFQLTSQRAVAVNSFMLSIAIARSNAAHRGRTVTICRSPDGQTCSNQGADWQAGWIVFVNTDDDEPPVRDSNEEILRAFSSSPNRTITSNRLAYSFRPYPDLNRVINGSIVFCDRRGPSQARAIIINTLGRPRLSSRDSENRPLRCPSG